jgi:hypothetical protein
MKPFLLIAFSVSSLCATAADWNLSSEKGLNDLMYLPKAQTYYGISKISAGSAEGQIGQIKIEDDNTKFNQEIGYAFSDKFLLAVDIGYLLSQKAKTTVSNSTSESKSKGIEDPSISLKYRALNQNSSAFNADLKLALSPSLGKQKDSDTNNKGNAYRGGSLYSVGADIGKKYTAMSWKLSTEVDFYGKKKSESQTAPITEDSDKARTDVNVGFSWQWVTGDLFTININIAYIIQGENSNEDPANDLRTVIDSTKGFAFGTDLIFQIAKNTSINLELNSISYDDADLKLTQISDGSSATGTVRDASESVFSIAAKYEF